MSLSRALFAAVFAATAACGGTTEDVTPGTTSAGTGTGTTTTGAGDAGAGGAGAGGGPSAEQACADVQAARCARLDACTGDHGVLSRYGDAATCLARGKASCLEALAAPGTGNSPAAVEDCAKATTAESCADYLDNNPSAACVPKAGQGATGAPCAFSAQCQSTYCAVGKDAVCGTCAPLPKAGDSCAATGECGRDLACPAATSVCVARGADGAACDTAAPCGPGLTCVGAAPAKGVKGACKASGTKAGDACDPKHQAAAGCDANLGLACEVATSTCVVIAFVDDGQPCGALKGGDFAACKAGATCALPQGSKEGTCVAPAKDGAACDTASGPGCLQPARCVAAAGGTVGTCKVADGKCP